jgi:hypothetical protein
VLNFRNLKKFRVDSRIKINGRAINESDLVNRSAYIQQDDLFLGNITVQEHLTFLVLNLLYLVTYELKIFFFTNLNF